MGQINIVWHSFSIYSIQVFGDMKDNIELFEEYDVSATALHEAYEREDTGFHTLTHHSLCMDGTNLTHVETFR